MMKHNDAIRISLAILTVVFAVSAAQADTLFLDYVGKSGTIGEALFMSIDPSIGAGTGTINPFLRLQANGVETGFNNGAKKPEFDTKDSLMVDLANVPLAWHGGDNYYYEFLFDINESVSNLVDMTDLEVYAVPQSSSTSGLSYAAVSSTYTPVYEFDYQTDGSLLTLDYRLNPGSGWGDAIMLLPKSLFPEVPTYIYMYTTLGESVLNVGLNASDDGFEEWAYGTSAITPEPTTLSLVALGGLAMLMRKKRRGVARAQRNRT